MIFEKKFSQVTDKFMRRLMASKYFKRQLKTWGDFDLKHWAWLYPDSLISSFDMIDIDKNFLNLATELRNEQKVVLSFREMWNIFNWVQRTSDVSGDLVELGVCSGGSAKLIASFKGNKRLHLFDTFEGIPIVDKNVDKVGVNSIKGDCLEEVQNYLKDYKDISYYKGIFPESANTIEKSSLKFSFVHIDFDVYPSTLEALKFFYPRMSPGGVIITHDYRANTCPGVKKAFDEFFEDKPEHIVELWDTQAIVIKNKDLVQ